MSTIPERIQVALDRKGMSWSKSATSIGLSAQAAVNELSAYLQIPKIVRQDIIFIHKPRQSKKSPYGYHHWESSYMLSADTNDTIDGLFLHPKSQLIYDEWYHSFTLAYWHERGRAVI